MLECLLENSEYVKVAVPVAVPARPIRNSNPWNPVSQVWKLRVSKIQ